MPLPIWACSVCYGDSQSAMAQGARAGVLFLLGVIALVLAGLVVLLVFWSRRARALDSAR